MSEGLSFSAFAGRLNVVRQTLYDWLKRHPEFQEARDIAWEKCRLFWEQKGIDGLYVHKEGPNLNTALWIYNMKCRFREEWLCDKPEEQPRTQDDPETLKVLAEYAQKRMKK